MRILNVDICVKLLNYRLYLKSVSEKIFTIADEFIIDKLDDFFVEKIFDRDLSRDELDLLIINNDNLVDMFREHIEKLSCDFKYNYDVEYVEHYLSFTTNNVITMINKDIDDRIKELIHLHKDFSEFTTIRLFKGYYGKLRFILRIENGGERNNGRR